MPTPGSRSRRGIEERKSEHRHPPGVPPAERAARFFGAPTGTRRTGARRVTRPGIRRVFGGGTRLRSTNRSKPDSGVPPPGTQPPGIGVGPVFGARRSRSRTGKRIEEPGAPPVPGGPSPSRPACGRPPLHDSGNRRRSKQLDARNLISLDPGVRRPRCRSAGRRRRRGPEPEGRSVFLGSGTGSDGSGRDSGVVPETTGVPGARSLRVGLRQSVRRKGIEEGK